MFGIPIIGPLLQMFIGPLFDWLKAREDTKVVEIKTKGDTKKAEIQADTIDRQTMVTALIATKNDPGIRVCRDLIMFCVAVHIACVAYVSAFARLIPQYTWEVLDFPPSMHYVPLAVIGLLFGYILKR